MDFDLEQLFEGASCGMILPSTLATSTRKSFHNMELDFCPVGSSRQRRVNTLVEDIEFCQSVKSLIKIETDSSDSDISFDLDDLDDEMKMNKFTDADLNFSVKREQLESIIETQQCPLEEAVENYHKDNNQPETFSQQIDLESLKTKRTDLSKCVSIDFRQLAQKSAISLNDVLKNSNEYNVLQQQMRSMKFPKNYKRVAIKPGCFETFEFHKFSDRISNSLKSLNDSHDPL